MDGLRQSTRPFTEEMAKEYILSKPQLKVLVGNNARPEQWAAREVGDGNINFIFVIEGPDQGLVLKQGLPYIRVIGESWKLTQDRIRIEALWLKEQHEICPEHVLKMHFYDPELSTIVMDYLPPPYINMRAGILRGDIYPYMARQVADFLSKSLFYHSRIALTEEQHKAKMDQFYNPELSHTTAKVIFVDPYHDEPINGFLKPELNEAVAEIWDDSSLKVAASMLRELFYTKKETIIHGDFHTGSVMACANGLFVIDAEFAFAGPMGFDIGKFLGNLLLTFFALDGHQNDGHPRRQQQDWLLNSVKQVWEIFYASFIELWDQHATAGAMLPIQFIDSPSSPLLKQFQEEFMKSLFREILGFAGACMIRRVISIAQIQDFTSIVDRDLRAKCSKKALRMGRTLLLQTCGSQKQLLIEGVIRLARDIWKNQTNC